MLLLYVSYSVLFDIVYILPVFQTIRSKLVVASTQGHVTVRTTQEEGSPKTDPHILPYLHFRNSPKSIQVIQTFGIFWHLGLDSLALGLASFSLPFSLEFFRLFLFGDFSSGSFLFTGAVGIGVAFLGWLGLASLALCHTALRFWLFLTCDHVFCIAVWTVALQIARKAKFQPSIDFLKMWSTGQVSEWNCSVGMGLKRSKNMSKFQYIYIYMYINKYGKNSLYTWDPKFSR